MDNQHNPQMLSIHLKKTKCDQQIGVSLNLGRTGSGLCQVATVLSFIAIRGNSPSPFFIDANGRALAKGRFVSAIHSILSIAGPSQQHHAGHSIRIGAATSATLTGIEDSMIQVMGHSAAFLQYIRMPREQQPLLSSVLASTATWHHLLTSLT